MLVFISSNAWRIKVATTLATCLYFNVFLQYRSEETNWNSTVCVNFFRQFDLCVPKNKRYEAENRISGNLICVKKHCRFGTKLLFSLLCLTHNLDSCLLLTLKVKKSLEVLIKKGVAGNSLRSWKGNFESKNRPLSCCWFVKLVL